jgi:hypothetical protein
LTILKQGTIPPGPTHRATLLDFAGVDEIRPETWRQLGNCIYERPAWSATLLSNGTVLVGVERAVDSYYYLLADRAAYEAWRSARLGAVRDPETGR